MPKLKPDTQRARREHILDAAERCFARAGFHRTTMHDICKEAGVSPGALYVYFSSKEELIAGIAERDRGKLAGELAELSKSPDLLAALGQLGEHYAVEEPEHKRVLCMEIAVESTRNEAVGEIFRSVDGFVLDSFEALFARAQA
jgi:TetR/AcrR family transcriptional repressor of uid operon